ncbi:cilia- and flagella-associated protein 144 isoform X1 [Ambystoma mexicanum]|uniref:cilia- and flagella-associated protein 144 isoform X1 n=1 Tax=Ambystoma mexicanum TaxID=8296 RepID=UPI0037E72233
MRAPASSISSQAATHSLTKQRARGRARGCILCPRLPLPPSLPRLPPQRPLLPGNVEVVAGKPMSWHDKMEDIVDDSFLNAIHHAALDPTKKYTEPQTTSQEVGWYSAPLINRNVNDRRLNFHRLKTEITEYMEAAWCQKEQSVNLQ